MKFRVLLAAALACVSLATQARTSDIVVSLAATDPASAADHEVLVDLTFTNTGKKSVRLLKWFVPDGDLEDAVFTITRNGKAVAYIGPHYKRGVPTLGDTVTLEAGASFTRTVDLSTYYDFSMSGVYSIQYGVDSPEFVGNDRRLGQDLEKHEIAEPSTLSSNEASMWLEGRSNARPSEVIDSVAKAGAISFSGRCSSTQQSTLLSAHGAATTMTNGAVSYLNGTPSATQRYTTWFGTYSSSGWSQVRTQFVAIKDVLDNKPVTYDCSCKKSYYAYVYPTRPYKIYLCRAFWSAPMTGTDSKGGTIVHETSHFDVVAGTEDWAYGHSAAKQLAINDPSKARNNADSHEYFAENTPPLP